MLTYERAKEALSYDPETGEFRWAAKIARKVVVGKIAGTNGGHGYRQIRVDGRIYKAHRIAWLLTTGRWPADEVDHINGVRTDNRIANLREATSGQNKQNLAKRGDNTSGFPGVAYHRNGWQAQLNVNGKYRYIGRYDTPEQAAAAYAKAKAELHTFQPVTRSA